MKERRRSEIVTGAAQSIGRTSAQKLADAIILLASQQIRYVSGLGMPINSANL